MPASLLLLSLLLLPHPVAPLCGKAECNCTHVESNAPPSALPLTHAKCLFQKRQRLELEAKDFPENLSRVEIAGGKELKFKSGVLARATHLESMTVRNLTKVYVQKDSFANLTTTSPRRTIRFRFLDLTSLVLEEHSFRNLKAPVSAVIARVAQLILQRAAFSWLADLTISTVPKLELLDEAFVLDNPKQSDVPYTTITLENVHMESLGRSTFHSPLRLVRITGSEIKKIKSEAFSSMYLKTVVLENTTIQSVEGDAFSSRTLMDTLEITEVRIHDIASNALLSGLNNLNIHRSKLGVVQSGAINVTVATVSVSESSVTRVHRKGFHLKYWNSISIRNNSFRWLEGEAFGGPYLIDRENSLSAPEFNFTGNSLHEVGHRAFDFNLTEELIVDIGENYFEAACHCDMREYARRTVSGAEAYREEMFESGLCRVDPGLAQCFRLPPGRRSMRNFTEGLCEEGQRAGCEAEQRDAEAAPGPPSVVSAVDRTPGERERRVLGGIFLITLTGMLVVTAMSASMWLTKKGYCAKARVLLPPSGDALAALVARAFSGGGLTPAPSVSRLPVHEYAELRRKAEEGAGEEEVPLEDKATQTLPEELTQELLQSLREKLDDPDNYKEARDMIEHLYDLIKVEESCNRNEDSASIDIEELGSENVYDVIGPGRKRSDPSARVGRDYVSTGTRAPSPDKLLPAYGEGKPAVVCEYGEPRDRRVHLYTEVVAGGGGGGAGAGLGALCDYGEPRDTATHLYCELPPLPGGRMTDRPLPDPHGPSTSRSPL